MKQAGGSDGSFLIQDDYGQSGKNLILLFFKCGLTYVHDLCYSYFGS